MRIGTVFSQADSGTDPDAIRAWATVAEEAGFAHLIAYDHVLGADPALYPDGVGNFPAPPYTHEHVFHEIFVLFSHLAAVTTSLELVTSVLVLPQRQTALVAKQAATLDLLSGGRLRLAVGVGWNWAEYQGLGADFATREDRLEEQIAVMRRLWTEPLVSFEGRFHQLDRVGLNPRPARPLPIWIGSGASPRVLRRVVRCADGWMPLLIPGLDPVPLPDAVARLRSSPRRKAGIPPACRSTGASISATAGSARSSRRSRWASRTCPSGSTGCASPAGPTPSTSNASSRPRRRSIGSSERDRCRGRVRGGLCEEDEVDNADAGRVRRARDADERARRRNRYTEAWRAFGARIAAPAGDPRRCRPTGTSTPPR